MNTKKNIITRKKKTGWWQRFLERVAKANEEALNSGCRS